MRIGWERDFLKESVSRFFYTDVVTPKRIHIIDQQMELLKPLGIDPDWYIEVPLKAREAARRSVKQKLGGLTDYIIINPGGNWPTKCWDAERYGELASRLMSDGFPIVVTWGPDEEGLVRKVKQKAPAIREIPTNLEELVALCVRARCILQQRRERRSLRFSARRVAIAMDHSEEKTLLWNAASLAGPVTSGIDARWNIGSA